MAITTWTATGPASGTDTVQALGGSTPAAATDVVSTFVTPVAVVFQEFRATGGGQTTVTEGQLWPRSGVTIGGPTNGVADGGTPSSSYQNTPIDGGDL